MLCCTHHGKFGGKGNYPMPCLAFGVTAEGILPTADKHAKPHPLIHHRHLLEAVNGGYC